ncbi:MAG TPA: DUF4440 domain-containing protein [Gemmatimonadaceae bacterium]|nr:DUF4440 domain-containing protein [Gemmatimonadaceae bacterium]
MHTRRSAVPALVLLAALTACQPAPQAISEKDVADLGAVIDRWIDGVINNRDSLANIIASDVIMMPPNQAPIVGHEAVMAYLKAYPTVTKFTANKQEVTGNGDLAYVRGTYAIDVKLPDNTAVHEDGTFLEVHRKQADGSWPYTRLIYHSTTPLPAPAPPPTRK